MVERPIQLTPISKDLSCYVDTDGNEILRGLCLCGTFSHPECPVTLHKLRISKEKAEGGARFAKEERLRMGRCSYGSLGKS